MMECGKGSQKPGRRARGHLSPGAEQQSGAGSGLRAAEPPSPDGEADLCGTRRWPASSRSSSKGTESCFVWTDTWLLLNRTSSRRMDPICISETSAVRGCGVGGLRFSFHSPEPRNWEERLLSGQEVTIQAAGLSSSGSAQMSGVTSF